MKIPKKLKIGGHWFNITLGNLLKEKSVDSSGRFVPRYNKILIDTDSTQSNQEATLIHEIIEVIDHQNELNLEHKTICILENSLYQVLKDNDLLV